jgi:hypothetical protein
VMSVALSEPRLTLNGRFTQMPLDRPQRTQERLADPPTTPGSRELKWPCVSLYESSTAPRASGDCRRRLEVAAEVDCRDATETFDQVVNGTDVRRCGR